MANATLLEFLKQYTEDIPASVQQGVIQNIFYDEKYFRHITFEASFSGCCAYEGYFSL